MDFLGSVAEMLSDPRPSRMALVHHANCRTFPAGISRWFCQFSLERSDNVAAGTHPLSHRRNVFVSAHHQAITGGAHSRLKRVLQALRPEPAAPHSRSVSRGQSEDLILAIMLIGTAPAWSQSLLKKLDPDNDGTVDLAEAKSTASKLFDKLDRDHDGTLDKRELRGRVSAKDFAVADPDKDGTLDKNEFLALVEKRFKAADPDNDGTIDAKELKSAAGRALVLLLK
jgi:Ca2+-binding EF-hand superfamily protein